jgi:hypothetical protein
MSLSRGLRGAGSRWFETLLGIGQRTQHERPISWRGLEQHWVGTFDPSFVAP